jgi:hypothetical protein
MMLSAFSNMETSTSRPTAPARHHRHARDRVHRLHQVQGDEGQIRLHAEPSASTRSRHRAHAGRVRRLHRGAAALRLLRDADELPALQQDEGHGPDRDLVGARRDAALPVDHPPVPHLLHENPEVWTTSCARHLRICADHREHEDAFIDLAFELAEVQGLTAERSEEYIRYIADRRLGQLGLQPIYQIEKNPLPWLDEMLNGVEHTNFFENRVTARVYAFANEPRNTTAGLNGRLGLGPMQAISLRNHYYPQAKISGTDLRAVLLAYGKGRRFDSRAVETEFAEAV